MTGIKATLDEIFEFILECNYFHRKKYGEKFNEHVPTAKEIRIRFDYSKKSRIVSKKLELLQVGGFIYRTSRGSNEYKIVEKYKKKLK